jgi:GT2 family glycosyltransferase
MQLSVVILNYNVRYFLEQCVLSVEKAIVNLDAEIIVVDNHSSDDSVQMMRSHFPQIKLIVNDDNVGFPKGNNIGVAQAKGKYICILNPDTVVAEDTFEKVIAFAESKPDLGIVGVKLIDGTGKFLPESKRGIPTPWVAFTKVSGLSKLSGAFNKYYAPHLAENETGTVEILVGAFMVMKRDLYNQVGGFDENCFMYSDDIDLSYMVLKTGKANYYFGETTVIHYKGESTVKDEKYMRRFREAMDFFYKKHFRKSVVFDVFMKAGAYFFSIFKKHQTEPEKKVFAYALISQDDELMAQLQPLLSKPIRYFGSDFNQMAAKSELLFDANQLTFKQIISKLEALKDSGATFKIVHKNEGFLIGSNSSNDRGQVIVFAGRR